MTTGFGSTHDEQAEQTSLIGPPAAATETHLPEPTPEEVQRALEGIEKQGLEPRPEKHVIEQNGKKIILDESNPLLGIDDTGTKVVKNGATWLSPTDSEYDSTLKAVAPQQAEQKSEHDEQKRSQQPSAEQQHYDETIKQIQTMAAIDEGSGKPNKNLDEAALQRARQGMSLAEAKNVKNILATVDGFAHMEATDINPEMHSLKPTAVSGPGVDLMMAKVRERKEKENAQVAELDRLRREKEKSKNG